MADGTAAVPLGEIVDLQRGTTYKSALLGKPGPVLLGLASIERNGGFRSTALKTYGGESRDKMLLRPGELYVSLKDVTQAGDLLGAVSRVPKTVPLGRLTQDTVKLTFKSNRVPLDYVYWLLRTPSYRDYCRARATGTTNLSLSREDFLTFLVPLPSTHQMTLAETLTALDDKIELNRQTAATLGVLCRALFESMIQGDKDGSPATSTLGIEFRITMGQSPPGDTYNIVGVGIPFYQGRVDFGSRYPARRMYCTAPTRLAQARDVLLSVRAPVGDLNIATEECAIGRGLAAVRHPTASGAYTFEVLRSLRRVLDVFNGEGTVFGSISGPHLRALTVPRPSPEAMATFERTTGPVASRLRVLHDESNQLAATRQALLTYLLAGDAPSSPPADHAA